MIHFFGRSPHPEPSLSLTPIRPAATATLTAEIGGQTAFDCAIATMSEARNPPALMVRSAALRSASRTMQAGRASFETPPKSVAPTWVAPQDEVKVRLPLFSDAVVL